ncbi:MAG TPA: DUF3040 domain-containing protein [Nocardioidaceae bacterium]|nr:DUF3040 domain-containing protein [Nocardioidaceae bacterium]
MPLSEEELRLLEQMERALVAEDPKLASTLRGTALRRNARRRAYVAAAAFVIGVGVLMAGAVMRQTIVGIIGFVVMLGSAYIALVSWKGQDRAATGTAGPAAAHPGKRGLSLVHGGKTRKVTKNRGPKRPLTERFEERWQRRRERNGY